MSLPYPGHPVRTRKLTRPITPIYPSHESLATFVGTASCPVCDAVYAPASSYEHLLHAPMIALESAFMSMCRFCFRCRRPACPACWDAVQGLCGDCVQQLALPFRQELAPFESILPMPTSRQSVSRSSSHSLHTLSSDNPLRCVYTGRFQQVPDMLSTTDPVPAAPSISPLRTYPANARTHLPITQDDIEAQPTQPPIQHRRSHGVRTSGYALRVERVFTSLLSLLLAAVVLLILITSISSQANSWIIHVFHIDIHALILALWSQLRQLFGRWYP